MVTTHDPEFRICVPMTHYIALFRIAAAAEVLNRHVLPPELHCASRCHEVVEAARQRIARSLSR